MGIQAHDLESNGSGEETSVNQIRHRSMKINRSILILQVMILEHLAWSVALGDYLATVEELLDAQEEWIRATAKARSFQSQVAAGKATPRL